ncbi:MAG TPA: hypothetical protein DEP87_03550 [Candidatus Pacebacteria bacterium]|nr:hypothetical protein [Candidatus Paceibacterota bacterium]
MTQESQHNLDDIRRQLEAVQAEVARSAEISGIRVSISPQRLADDGSPCQFQIIFPDIRPVEGDAFDVNTIDLPDDPQKLNLVLEMLPALAAQANQNPQALLELLKNAIGEI